MPFFSSNNPFEFVTNGRSPADERRRLERTPFSKPIMYCIGNVETLNQNGHIFDISKAGMGIHTDYPLRRGSVIKFDAIKEGIDFKTGIVRKTIMLDKSIYRTGIEFI